MSLWDKIGDVYEAAGDSVGTGLAMWADVAQAMVDTADDNGFGRTQAERDLIDSLRERGADWAQRHRTLVGGTTSVLEGLDRVTTYGVKRPISTVAQVTGMSPLTGFAPTNLLTGGPSLTEAWRNSERTSPGQALQVSTNRALGVGPQDYASAWQYGKQGDKTDPWFAFFSGTQDFVVSWYADPFVVGGKAAGAANRARKTLKPGDLDRIAVPRGEAKGLTKRQTRLHNRFNDLLDATRGKSEAELYQLAPFRESAVGDTLATLIAKANRETDDAVRDQKVRDILRVGHGDIDYIRQLKERGDSLADDIENLHEDLSWAQHADDHPDVVARKERLREEIARRKVYRDEIDRLLSVQFSLGDEIGRADDAMTAIRLGRLRQDTVAHDGLGSTPIHLMRWASDYRPAGWVKLKDSRHTVQNVERMLNRVREIDPATRMELLNGVIRAGDAEGRRQAVERVEKAVFEAVAKRYGEKPEIAEKLYAEYGRRREKILARWQNRAYTGARDENGDLADRIIWDEQDGVFRAAPILDTQLDNEMPLVDVGHLYRAFSADRGWRSAVPKLDQAGELTTEALDLYSTLWKVSRLMRVGYAIRTVMDPQIRMMTTLGALGYLATASRATRNMMVNRLGRITVAEERDIAERMAAQARLDEIEDILAGRVEYSVADEPLRRALPGRPALPREPMSTEPAAAGGAPTSSAPREIGETTGGESLVGTRESLDDLRAEAERLRARLAQPEVTVRRRRKKSEFDRLGYGEQGRIELGPYRLTPAHGDTPEDLDTSMFEIDASESFKTLMDSEASRQRRRLRHARAQFEVKRGGQIGHEEALLHAVNNQIRQSALAKHVIDGRDDEWLLRWLRRDPEGRAYARRMRSVYHGDLDDMVRRTRMTVDSALAQNDALYEIARKRNLTSEDYLRHVGDREKWPEINAGEVAESVAESAWGAFKERSLDRFYRLFNDLPETVMGRHPLYVRLYEHRYKQLVRNADPGLAGHLTGEELAAMREAAVDWARAEMKRTLFDVSARSNVAHTFRWVWPFFAAWQDTMQKYGRLAIAHPDMIPRAAMVWSAPEQMGLTVDADGNPVKPGTGLSDDQFVILPSIPGVKHLTSADRWRVSKASVNIVLQGDPWWLPGFGPMAAIPANELAKRHTRLAGEFDRLGILPFGVEQDSKQLGMPLPTWTQRVVTAFNPDSDEYKETFSKIYATEVMRINAGERERPKSEEAFLDEIANRTRNWYIARAAANGVLPFSATPQTDKQFYFDKAHEYREKFPNNWETRFYRDFPEYFEATVSLSKSNTGVDATQEAFDASKKYAGLIARKPEFGWFVVGEEGIGEYSQAVRAAQFSQRVAPGSSVRFREQKDPREAATEIQAEKGWIEYQAMMRRIDSVRQSWGLRSLQSAAAAPLAEIKRQYTAWLGEQNPAWRAQYESAGGSKLPEFLRFAAEVANDRRMRGRGDIEAMRVYLQMRERMQQVLATREASTLSASSNADLAQVWSEFTTWLRDRYVTFGDVYDRMLEQDDLSVRI